MADDALSDVCSWLAGYAGRLGLAAPTEDELEAVLELAGAAARASARQAAPVACWLAARAGLSPAEALRIVAAP